MPMYDLCMGMMARKSKVGSIHEASEYAVIGAMVAWLDGYFTESWVRDALYNTSKPSIPGELKAAFLKCGRGYLESNAAMLGVWRKLPECCNLGDEHRMALRRLRACKDSLAKLPDLQLLGKVEADYDRTMVVYLLGKFIGIK